jgi:hypothetical protein
MKNKIYYIREYLYNKKSTGEIAKELNVTSGAVLAALRKYGIERRTNQEAQILIKRDHNNCKCLVCGNEFHSKPYEIKRGKGKYCSYKCYYESRSKQKLNNGVKFNTNNSSKEKNGNYKNGSSIYKLSNYIRNAKNRNIECSLEIDDVKELWQKPCVYCGSPIKTIGIDRIDNSKGYVKGNIASCCQLCNWMKRELTVDKFIDHIKRVINYYTEGGDAKCEHPLSKKL